MKLTLPQATDWVAELFERKGCSRDNARSVAKALVAAEADGLKGHGFSRIPTYLAMLATGKVDGNAVPQAKATAPSVLSIDAGDGYATYKWSTGDTTQKIVVTQPGTFTVAVADPGGCSGTSEPVEVTINQAPAPKITASTLTLCPGDSAVLDAGSGYAKYRWADGRSIQKIIVRTAGSYQVTVTELVGWEHSMKNELIIASYKNLPRRKAAERLTAMLGEIGLEELSARFFTSAQAASS